MATNVNLPKATCLITSSKSVNSQHSAQPVNFEPLDKSSSNTLKRNPKMELSKADLLKLLSYLEGELQARDVVIATLKCEKMKHMLTHGQYKTSSLADPISALHRDNFAAPSRPSDQTDITVVDNQLTSLENLVLQQRKTQIRMANILKVQEMRHRKDLELERQAKKRLEKDLKKISDVSDEDKNRQKQIVLLLLAERKRIVMKYIEERKRSEDLAQILSEEKSRIDTMAEGLEEESKKSLQMEAELEKQLAQFDTESQVLRANLLREEKRVKELELELEKSRSETSLLEKQLSEFQQAATLHSTSSVLQRPTSQNVVTPVRMGAPGWTDSTESVGQVPLQGNSPMISSVAKVVQPTATVSSVPVCGPTTGVARSISPGHGLRSASYCPPIQSGNLAKVEKRVVNNTMISNSKSSTQSAKSSSLAVTTGNGKGTVSRGIPPPVPPNKPVVPPKKESVLMRRSEVCEAVKCPKDATKPLSGDNQDQTQGHHDHTETYQNINVASQSGVV